ncbi:MAG: GtrA family protein [Sphingobacteriaceae bacterium]|jgi:putative flippase GtrA|nr:GtrA family protein [Sphingobacteriaceae bacterium]
MRNTILAFVDFFYKPFKKFIPKTDFRYLAIGGSTWLLGNLIYAIAYEYIFTTAKIELLDIDFKRENAALVLHFIIVIPYGFLMNKFIVFAHSKIKSSTQFIRFIALVTFNILLNYLLLKYFIESLFVNAITAKIIISIGLAAFSYIYQQYFTFGVKKIRKKA